MTLSSLHTLYYVFLFMTVFFFLLTIILFFVLDIKRVFLIRTGKAAKKDIKKLEEESFKTGRLSKYNSANSVYVNSAAFGESEEFDKTESINASEPDMPARQSEVVASAINETTVLSNEGETTVLNTGETTVLSQNPLNSVGRKFNIVKKEMLIHTDEVI